MQDFSRLAKTPLIVAGATASGKSELAIWLAQRLDGEILSIDAVQSWRGFDIGSGKVAELERGGIAHHLIDSSAPELQGNVATFYEQASAICGEIINRGRQTIFCGGTTMYISALLQGLADQPGADPELRLRFAQQPSDLLWAQLIALSPSRAAALHPNDRVRVIRALETGLRPVQNSPGRAPISSLVLVLCWPRDQLYSRIEQRVVKMLDAGLVAEVQALRAQYGNILPGFAALGYAEVCAMLDGKLPESELCVSIVRSTRQYAKRQMTFWRNEPRKRGFTIEPREGGTINSTQVEIGAEGGGAPSRRSEMRRGFLAAQISRVQLLSEIKTALDKMNANPGSGTQVWYLDGRGLDDYPFAF